MRFILDKITNLRCGWNERPLDEKDFYRLCKRFRITVQEMPLRVGGFYYCLLGGHYIAVDQNLPPQEKLFVMFHEFAHFLLHVPDSGVTANFHGIGKRTRKEIEADMFALCALVPRESLFRNSPEEIAESETLSSARVAERIGIFEKYGI